ncbi:MAG: hypothetical protein LBL71_01175 [Endomicrobium sp.]|jgi:uncharacterized membrane protein|nr:hypothetical protein [Endomicrobium sp.]
MKKITVLILVLGLAVPAQAWHLFPVKEKPVTENKDNSVSYGVIGGVAFGIGVVVGLFLFYLIGIGKAKYIYYTTMNNVNKALNKMCLGIDDVYKIRGISEGLYGTPFDIDTEQIKNAVLEQHKD